MTPGTVVLRGARNKSWIVHGLVVAACLCSSQAAGTAAGYRGMLHPFTGARRTTLPPVGKHGKPQTFQCANGPGKRKEPRPTCWVHPRRSFGCFAHNFLVPRRLHGLEIRMCASDLPHEGTPGWVWRVRCGDLTL